MLLGVLSASLLRNMLLAKGVIKNREGTLKGSQDF